MKSICTTLVLVLICNILAAQQQWKIASGKRYNLVIPADWTYSENVEGMPVHFTVSSPNKGKKDKFRENVSLIVDHVNLGVPIEDVADLIKAQVKRATNNMVVESTLKHADGNAMILVYTTEVEGYKLKFRQVIIIEDEKLSVFVYTAEEKMYDEYLPTIEKIMQSTRGL